MLSDSRTAGSYLAGSYIAGSLCRRSSAWRLMAAWVDDDKLLVATE
jgi:hypothetical protein